MSFATRIVRATYVTTKARDLLVGDILDLAGDLIADPDSDSPTFEFEYVTVAAIEEEAPDCIIIDIDGDASYGFPPDHELRVHGHDTEHDPPESHNIG